MVPATGKLTKNPLEPGKFPQEEWGIHDARIIRCEEEKKWLILYTSLSVSGPAVSLAETTDFKNFKKKGVILPPENKDSAFFPEKINGKWMIIHRPVSHVGGKINIWYATSPDLIHWGEHKVLMRARSGPFWDGRKIGLSTPPLKTKEGWLITYHGVKPTNYGDLYRVGLALLDLKDPSKVLKRSSSWVFGPEEPCEVYDGDIGNVVFPGGWFHNKKNNKLYLYYGAADTSVGLATADFDEVMKYMMDLPKPAA